MTADILITNARVLTIDSARPRAEALAITGNRITWIGSAADASAHKGKHTRVNDAGHKTVMPGIIESHLHIFAGAVELDSLHVNHINGFQQLSDSVREYAAKRPNDPVIVANGGNYMMLRPEGVITRHDLDAILPDRPFILICFDHHTVWANTKALEKAGILHGKGPLPPGNEIVMGPDGKALGQLKEPAAYSPVLALTATGGREFLGLTTGEDPVPPASAAQHEIDRRYLKTGLDYCASLGITSLHNMDGNWYQLELLDAMREAGDLIVRSEMPFHHKNFFELSRIDEAVEMRAKYHGDMLHSGRVKVFMDGVIESMTALMLDDYPGHPGERGAPLFTAGEFKALATRADKHGLQISVHAIGDGGVRRTLDGYEAARRANGARDSRHRIEHIELIDPADVPRLKELGVIASLQPIVGLGVPGATLEPCLSLIGGKLPWSYAWQTLRNAGACVAFSSDWPVSPLDPFLGMQSAMTQMPVRPDCPPQAQSLHDTLHAFTLAGAHMEFMEDRKGMLKEGYLADVIVLDSDIESTPAEAIGTVKPVTTICDGRVTFER
jgi:predicted amidohydrolase YtcJ